MNLRTWLKETLFKAGLIRHQVDPMGPVFVSYRQSDGTDSALEVARACRAWGIPIWHDLRDLPPGEWERSIRAALDAGLSGGVLVITPEVGDSQVVIKIELPALLRLAKDETFTFAIATGITSAEDGKTDFSAADRLLFPKKRPRLNTIKQYNLADIHTLAREFAHRRMTFCRDSDEAQLVLDLQTREEGRAWTPSAPLVVRVPVPRKDSRVPPREVWRNLEAFLEHLPELLHSAGKSGLLVRGGAHLSVAVAIGAAVPSTVVRVHAEDTARDVLWTAAEAATAVDFKVAPEHFDNGQGPAAVLVDLVPTSPPHDTFTQEVSERRDSLGGCLRITRRDEEIPAAQGAATALEIARTIRDFVSKQNTNEIHLYLRVPWPIALFLGREFNTLRVHLYEWDDLAESGWRYAPMATVTPGTGGSPIANIAAEESLEGKTDGDAS